MQCLRLPQYRAQHLNETFPLLDNDLPVGQQRLSTHGASPTANLSKDYGHIPQSLIYLGQVMADYVS